MTVIRIPRQPAADPAQAAALQALADRCAAAHGDTPERTAARRAALLADLNRHQTQRGRQQRNPRARAARGGEGGAA